MKKMKDKTNVLPTWVLKKVSQNSKKTSQKTSKKTLLSGVVFASMFGLNPAQAMINDLQINALIMEAVTSHPSVEAAIAEHWSTKENITASKLSMLPTPSLSTGYNHDYSQVVSTASLNQPLWTHGRLTAGVNQAIYNDKAAIEGVYEQQNSVAENTISAWQSYITAVGQ